LKAIAPFLIAFALAVAAFAIVAHAQQMRCEAPGEMARQLHERWGELPILRFTDRKGRDALIFSNVSTGSWTFVVVLGQSWCITNFGEGLVFMRGAA
jgi:hypothetical protein